MSDLTTDALHDVSETRAFNKAHYVVAAPITSAVTVRGAEGKLLMGIQPDGTVVWGGDPSEAATVFCAAIRGFLTGIFEQHRQKGYKDGFTKGYNSAYDEFEKF